MYFVLKWKWILDSFHSEYRKNTLKESAEELMLLNCGVGEDCWESLGLQGDPTSPSWRRSVLNIHWKDWCHCRVAGLARFWIYLRRRVTFLSEVMIELPFCQQVIELNTNLQSTQEPGSKYWRPFDLKEKNIILLCPTHFALPSLCLCRHGDLCFCIQTPSSLW